MNANLHRIAAEVIYFSTFVSSHFSSLYTVRLKCTAFQQARSVQILAGPHCCQVYPTKSIAFPDNWANKYKHFNCVRLTYISQMVIRWQMTQEHHWYECFPSMSTPITDESFLPTFIQTLPGIRKLYRVYLRVLLDFYVGLEACLAHRVTLNRNHCHGSASRRQCGQIQVLTITPDSYEMFAAHETTAGLDISNADRRPLQ